MKKLIALLAVIFVGISLSACQSSENGSDASPSKTSASVSATKEAPVSLNGTWNADGFEATIAADSIVINIVSTDSKSLYWKGTFTPGTDKVTSLADREALDSSILGSQDTDKVFAVDDDKISFEMSMMGTTKTIRLKKA